MIRTTYPKRYCGPTLLPDAVIYILVMPSPSPLVFYDIASPLGNRSYAPNPSKARLALNFKAASYSTKYVDIPDIPDIRKGLKCSATRKFDDWSEYYTLPMLQDLETNSVIGDSMDIANYLEDKYPNSSSLFPKDATIGLDYESPNKDTAFFAPLTPNSSTLNPQYAEFNVNVDATFSAYVILNCQFLPFNPESADVVKSLFVKRAHLSSWNELCIPHDSRAPLIQKFKDALTTLAQKFMVDVSGPYLNGNVCTYADLIVGGWLNMLSIIMPREEWSDFQTWHEGVFGQLFAELQTSFL